MRGQSPPTTAAGRASDTAPAAGAAPADGAGRRGAPSDEPPPRPVVTESRSRRAADLTRDLTLTCDLIHDLSRELIHDDS